MHCENNNIGILDLNQSRNISCYKLLEHLESSGTNVVMNGLMFLKFWSLKKLEIPLKFWFPIYYVHEGFKACWTCFWIEIVQNQCLEYNEAAKVSFS